jgi:uncharacterized protein YndB with AHSA1/START domain
MDAQRSSGEASATGDEGVSRVFDAPRGLVFEAWTKATHFMRWFGPHGAEVVDCELDARPGGILRFGHRFADGTTIYVKGAFVEVVREKRLVFTFAIVDEHGHPVRHPMFSDWPLDASIETVVLLDDVEGGTRVSVAHRVLPAELASHPATKRWLPLALQGSTQVLERLGEHLSLSAPRKEST